jgi:hypothetical protein
MLREQRLSRMLLTQLSPKPLMRDDISYVNFTGQTNGGDAALS